MLDEPESDAVVLLRGVVVPGGGILRAAGYTHHMFTRRRKERGRIAAIRIDGGSDIFVGQNYAEGVPLLDATGVERLTTVGNVTVARRVDLWAHRHPWLLGGVMTLLGVLASALLTAWL